MSQSQRVQVRVGLGNGDVIDVPPDRLGDPRAGEEFRVGVSGRVGHVPGCVEDLGAALDHGFVRCIVKYGRHSIIEQLKASRRDSQRLVSVFDKQRMEGKYFETHLRQRGQLFRRDQEWDAGHARGSKRSRLTVDRW
jgi:hypothetical protein